MIQANHDLPHSSTAEHSIFPGIRESSPPAGTPFIERQALDLSGIRMMKEQTIIKIPPF
jgi:hypothetical protein